ncbi:hypothetical protein B0T17DRAFT_484773, partial [Bombardia bombarda]
LPPAPRKRTKKELLALVDPYDHPYDEEEATSTVDEHLRSVQDPYMRSYAPADGPNLTITRNEEDLEYPTFEQVSSNHGPEGDIIAALRHACLTYVNNPERWADLDHIWDLYQRLPEPRITYMDGRMRGLLFWALGQPKKKDTKSMLRYFAVVADTKNSGFPLTLVQWNGAIAFAGRYLRHATEADTESALKLWRDMEYEAGIRANDVTFNILFDVATNAGNFALAEMIYAEMEARGLRFDRYSYVSLMHFFGLRLDTSGVRATYREMVSAGEMIDTVALNAVLKALLLAREEDAADRLYERMKASVDCRSAETQYGTKTNSAQRSRRVTKALMRMAELGRARPEMQPTLQADTPIHPDLLTFRLLLKHYCVEVGDLGRVAGYIDDMRALQIPLHGAIFVALFRGFAIYGGIPFSPWSEARLESIFAALISALDDKESEIGGGGGGGGGGSDVEIQRWMVVHALKAFARCSTRAKVLDVYEALKERWRLSFAEEQFMKEVLSSVFRELGVGGRGR